MMIYPYIHLDKRWKLIWDKVQNERTHEHYQQVIYNKYNTNVINVEELDGSWPASAVLVHSDIRCNETIVLSSSPYNEMYGDEDNNFSLS